MQDEEFRQLMARLNELADSLKDIAKKLPSASAVPTWLTEINPYKAPPRNETFWRY